MTIEDVVRFLRNLGDNRFKGARLTMELTEEGTLEVRIQAKRDGERHTSMKTFALDSIDYAKFAILSHETQDLFREFERKFGVTWWLSILPLIRCTGGT